MRSIAAVMMVSLAWASLAGAAVAAESGEAAFAATTLSLSAYGETPVKPDIATLTLGVETTRPTAASAMRDNAQQMTRVIAALKGQGLADKDLQTANLGLTPQYIYQPNQPSRLSGYLASNQVVVTVRDLSKLGPLADAVVQAGADTMGQIGFGLANPKAAEDVARLAAVKALEDKAALYAQASGYHIVRLVNLSEGGAVVPGPRPMPMMAFAKAQASTPVETGEGVVRIEVSGVFELAK